MKIDLQWKASTLTQGMNDFNILGISIKLEVAKNITTP